MIINNNNIYIYKLRANVHGTCLNCVDTISMRPMRPTSR